MVEVVVLLTIQVLRILIDLLHFFSFIYLFNWPQIICLILDRHLILFRIDLAELGIELWVLHNLIILRFTTLLNNFYIVGKLDIVACGWQLC